MGTVDRISPADAMELATDVGPAQRTVGALLVLEDAPPDGDEPEALAAELAARFDAVPRFRRRLRRPPAGFGRPYWVPWSGMSAELIEVRAVPAVDDATLVAVCARELGRPLDRDRPQWRAVVLSHEGRAVGVVLAMHHVLADGIGGLAVLAGLADRPVGSDDGQPSPRGDGRSPHAQDGPHPGTPGRWALLRDAWSERWHAARRLPSSLRRAGAGRAELEHGPRGAPRCSLNAPCGAERAAHLAEVDLAALRAGARSAGASVNDALLVAVAGAMGDALRRRGEHPDALVVSVPVSARRDATSGDLGNAVGVMPVRVPLTGTPAERLALVAASTRDRKARSRGSSLALLAPVFRLLAALGVFRWFVERQRLVNTFLTNLRGPQALTLAGRRVRRIAPLGVVAGNVAVAFAALSYAGQLTVTVVTDPAVAPEGATIAAAVDARLAELAALA